MQHSIQDNVQFKHALQSYLEMHVLLCEARDEDGYAPATIIEAEASAYLALTAVIDAHAARFVARTANEITMQSCQQHHRTINVLVESNIVS